MHTFLVDLRAYVPLHPFIVPIEALPALEALPSASVHRVVERIPLGPLKLKTVYVVALEPRGNGEVRR